MRCYSRLPEVVLVASMSLFELTRGFADIPSALANISILDLVLDSRQVTEGSGFIAVQGLSLIHI